MYKKRVPCAAFIGCGEVNTPQEFIIKRSAEAANELRKRDIDVFETPIVNDDPDGALSDAAVNALKGRDFDAIVLCIAGWIPSWAVIRTIEPFRHKPILLFGLSGWYNNGRFGRFVTTADQAGTTALRAPMHEMGFNFKYLVNFKDAQPRWNEAANYIRAAAAANHLRSAVIGMCGYRDMRLYGTLYDGCAVKKTVGPEIEHFDLLEIKNLEKSLPAYEVTEAVEHVTSDWNYTRAPRPETILATVRLGLAMQAKIVERGYDAFSFCDVDGVKKLLQFAPAGSLTLLHDRLEIPTVPENDSYGAVTQTIMHELTGEVPAYMEFYEFLPSAALMGVPDYVPGSMVDGKVTVMPNAFGSFGEGLLNVSKLRTGEATISRLAQVDGQFVMHAVSVNAETPAPWEEAGWAQPAPQLPSLQMDLRCPSDRFLSNVLGQHYIVSYGNRLNLIADFCQITGIRLIH